MGTAALDKLISGLTTSGKETQAIEAHRLPIGTDKPGDSPKIFLIGRRRTPVGAVAPDPRAGVFRR